MSNVKDVDKARHAWDTSPFLLIVSPTPPVQSVDAYVRKYVRRYVRTDGRSVNHVTTKRKEVDHNLWVWGSVPRARGARGSPSYNTINWRDTTNFDSEDDYRTGCRNISHCQQQHAYSGLRSTGRSNSTYFWNDSWAQTFHSKDNIIIFHIHKCYLIVFVLYTCNKNTPHPQ